MTSHTLNIDDLGATKKSTDCTIELLLNNKANTASILVNSNYFQYAVELIKKYNLFNRINLHFNITQGKSLSGVNSLTDKNGFFKRENKENKIFNLEDVYKEFELQSSLFPHFQNIDCHHNINYYYPEIHKFLLTKSKGYVREEEKWKSFDLKTIKSDVKNYNIYFHPTYENDEEMKIFSPNYNEIRVIDYLILNKLNRG